MSSPLGAGGALLRKSFGRHRAQRLGDDPLGGLARQPRAVLAADQGHRAGRNADAAGEIRPRHAVPLKPVAKLHAPQIVARVVLCNSIDCGGRLLGGARCLDLPLNIQSLQAFIAMPGPRAPSLREAKRRSNPEIYGGGGGLDCFASLAMTWRPLAVLNSPEPASCRNSRRAAGRPAPAARFRAHRGSSRAR